MHLRAVWVGSLGRLWALVSRITVKSSSSGQTELSPMLGATKIGRCPGCRGRFGTDKSQQWPVENDAQQVFSVYICCFLSMRHDWRAVPPPLHMRVQVASCVQRCRWAAKIISRMQTDPEASSRIQQAPPSRSSFSRSRLRLCLNCTTALPSSPSI